MPNGIPLELIAYRMPKGAHPPGLGEANTRGLRHVAFLVGDLDGVVASLKSAGAEFLSEVQQVPSAQVEFPAIVVFTSPGEKTCRTSRVAVRRSVPQRPDRIHPSNGNRDRHRGR